MPAEDRRDGEEDLEKLLATELSAADLRRLTDLVYRLLQEDLILARERGGPAARQWR